MPPSDLLDHLQHIVVHARAGNAPDERTQVALKVVVDWLAERVPYKTPLPRGYSMLWSVKTDKQGQTHRYHQLLRKASSSHVGVWIDTENLEQVEVRDLQVFAEDISTGFLKELLQHLQGVTNQ